MSQEDVKYTVSPGADASGHCNGHSLSQCKDHGPESESQGQDGIVLDRIASLSLDMFNPSDFTGRFTKIQPRSRKRTKIIRGGCRQVWDLKKKKFVDVDVIILVCFSVMC